MMQRKTPNDQGAALLSILMIVAVMSVAALAAVEALGRSLSLARVSSERKPSGPRDQPRRSARLRLNASTPWTMTRSAQPSRLASP